MNYKTIIIDDELPALQRLERLLADFPEIEIIDKAMNGPEAVEKINSLKPDLIFLDIQMPGFDGFEVVSKLKQLPIIVFVTAYDEYALQAFETNSIDYLLKPVKKERLETTISKLKTLTTAKDTGMDKHILNLLASMNKKSVDNIVIKSTNDIIFIKTADIYFFKAEDKYTTVCTYDEEYILDESLTELENRLTENFIRVHRSCLINSNYLLKLKKWFDGKFIAVMKDKKNSELPVSKSAKDKLGI